MKKTKNIKDCYETLNPADRTALLSYKDKIKKGELKQQTGRLVMVDNIARQLSSDTNIPLSEWDIDIALAFVKQPNWVASYRRLALSVLSDILKCAGNPIDITKIKSEELISESNFILTYSHLLEIIKSGITSDEILREKPYELSANSSAIAAIYLSWIGLTVNDIVTLPASSVHIRERAVCIGSKVYSYHEFPEISEFMKAYSDAEYFISPTSTGLRKHSFIESPYFIKQSRQGSVAKSKLIQKVKAFSGQSLGNIRRSGRLNKLYRYEQDGMRVELTNYEELAKLLDIDNPSGAYSSINLLLSDYAVYKKLRTKTLEGKV